MQTPATGPAAAPVVVGSFAAALMILDSVRHDQGMTRQEWAECTPGVSGGQLSEWLRGKHEPAAPKLFALAETLGLTWSIGYKIENED